MAAARAGSRPPLLAVLHKSYPHQAPVLHTSPCCLAQALPGRYSGHDHGNRPTWLRQVGSSLQLSGVLEMANFREGAGLGHLCPKTRTLGGPTKHSSRPPLTLHFRPINNAKELRSSPELAYAQTPRQPQYIAGWKAQGFAPGFLLLQANRLAGSY